ncbi:prophage tail fiber N-terminal domain-containing protein [Serratia sp. DD3]|uniref:phage tail fiber protein n=1 Tax=Serratia sp. DD3 TaxID=1410619 RepID=UPI0004D7FD5D|nr:prophage tail fiber N-terminal domain-containing protein [Serratia sp. DD3]KEY58515.1 hypothetical protein SRDD_27620 [Serratia sp. DD3]
MTVISGILKDPIGGPRSGVVIELRAVRTSATVVNQARSQSITDATGKYTLTVEPGAYDVTVTTDGRQPERVGGITVALNSKPGTLNDFLTMPGEADLNPAIVEAVDRMRAEAAASAAAAKISEVNAKTSSDNSASVLANTYTKDNINKLNATASYLSNTVTWQRVGKIANFGQNGRTLMIHLGGNGGYNGGTGNNGFATIIIRSGNGTVTTINKPGRASVSAYVTAGTLILDIGLIESAANTYELYIKYDSFASNITATIDNTSISDTFSNWTWDRTVIDEPEIILGHEIVKSWTSTNLVSPLKKGDYGLGGTDPINEIDANTISANGFIKYGPNTPNAEGPGYWAGISGGFDSTSRWTMVFGIGSPSNNKIAVRGRTSAGVFSPWSILWHSTNTTVDANGFIKKASPIVKLFGDGQCELNDESHSVTTERISEGVYRISGTLGFNSDAEWGGVDGGIEIPIDRNKLPLVWVDYEVDEAGDLLIKTFHRINSTAPEFAQNVKAGYKEGQPIDIPAGRWIDLRVEMPAGDEPEPVIESESIQQPEVETDQPAELEQGDTPEAETKK